MQADFEFVSSFWIKARTRTHSIENVDPFVSGAQAAHNGNHHHAHSKNDDDGRQRTNRECHDVSGHSIRSGENSTNANQLRKHKPKW